MRLCAAVILLVPISMNGPGVFFCSRIYFFLNNTLGNEGINGRPKETWHQLKQKNWMKNHYQIRVWAVYYEVFPARTLFSLVRKRHFSVLDFIGYIRDLYFCRSKLIRIFAKQHTNIVRKYRNHIAISKNLHKTENKKMTSARKFSHYQIENECELNDQSIFHHY